MDLTVIHAPGTLQHSFSVADYYQMASAGILSADDRVELLDGQVVEMSPIGNRHAASVDELTEQFVMLLADRVRVRIQGPVRLSDLSEPEPDVALLVRREDRYAGGHPRAEHVRLLVEVADASIEKDRSVKLPLYAQAGIPEVWIVDLGSKCIEVYRQSAGRSYGHRRTVKPGETLSPEAFPDAELSADAILCR